MNKQRRHIINGQRGFGALEVLIALIIATLAIVGGATVYMRHLDRQSNLIASGQMSILADAASRYIKDNYAAIVGVATPSAPAVITTNMLRTTGYLPNGFSDANAYGQSYLVLALAPTPNQLQTLILTQNGEIIKELYLIEIAKQIGAKGGYISSVNTGVVTGSFGGWSTPLAPYGVTPGAGHLATALFFDDGALVNDYLYRHSVPGHPEVNTMNTSINVNGNDLNAVKTANTVTLNATQGNITTATTTTTNATVVNSGTTNTTGETYTGGWFRTNGDSGWYNQKWNGGWYMSDPTWVRSYADKNVYTGGTVLAGALQSGGRTTVGEFLQINGVANAGWGCAPNGLIGRNASGLILSCQSGVWKGGGGGPGALSFIGGFTGGVTRANTTTAPMFVSAYGGNSFAGGTCTNRYQMTASVFYGSWITVADSAITDDTGYKTVSFGFMVPAGSTYQITSNPYTCGAGVINVTELTQ